MRRPTISRLQWRLLQLVRKLWFRATLFSLLAIATALIAVVLKPFLPDHISADVGANSVDDILSVIASSMLAVTIFSLSTMVSAYIAASANVSPRAIRLLAEDGTAHNALGTFIGAFLFSLVGIIALSTGVYGEEGRLVLFAVTLVVVAFVVGTLLHWIDHVSKLGQVAQTSDLIERATAKAMRARHEDPYLGGQPLLDAGNAPPGAIPIYPQRVGYVQHLDVEALSELAGEHSGSSIFVTSPPGSLVERTRPLAWVQGVPAEDVREEVCDAFSIDNLRSYDQDPRFGAAVLAEIASHALSPGINDPGTAIDIIGRAVRVLSIWQEPRDAEADRIRHPQVHVPGIELDDLFDDLFRPIARDGAAIVEVGIRLQKALCALARVDDPRFLRNAQHHSQQALQRALAALTIEPDKQQLRVLAAQITEIGTPAAGPGS